MENVVRVSASPAMTAICFQSDGMAHKAEYIECGGRDLMGVDEHVGLLMLSVPQTGTPG